MGLSFDGVQLQYRITQSSQKCTEYSSKDPLRYFDPGLLISTLMAWSTVGLGTVLAELLGSRHFGHRPINTGDPWFTSLYRYDKTLRRESFRQLEFFFSTPSAWLTSPSLVALHFRLSLGRHPTVSNPFSLPII